MLSYRSAVSRQRGTWSHGAIATVGYKVVQDDSSFSPPPMAELGNYKGVMLCNRLDLKTLLSFCQRCRFWLPLSLLSDSFSIGFPCFLKFILYIRTYVYIYIRLYIYR